MATLQMTGRTREIKDRLKAAGWKWQPATQCWVLSISDAAVAAIASGRDGMREVLRAAGAWKKCCMVMLDGREIWCDSGFHSYIAAELGQPTRGDIYDCDAAGNYAAGPRITGSLDSI